MSIREQSLAVEFGLLSFAQLSLGYYRTTQRYFTLRDTPYVTAMEAGEREGRYYPRKYV